MREPDSGLATLGDIDILKQKDDVRHRLGYLPQEFGVYPRISAQDMLSHIALLKGVTHVKQRKDLVGWMLKRCDASLLPYDFFSIETYGSPVP